MVSGEGAPRALSPTASNDDSFPQFPRSERPGPPSIISSRMTDIMTDDGGDPEAHRGAGSQSQRRSAFYSDAPSRPGTARTGMSQRAPWAQGTSLRRGLSGKRGSVAGSIGSASQGARPVSAMSRSHVPTLTSHAFFRPMSSQKLQAQRGITRPTTMNRQIVSHDDGETNRDSMVSSPGSGLARQPGDEGEMQPPPSRGTEYTEQEPFDRITANTSPTYGHHATSSMADSVHPLQRKPEAGRTLTLDMGKTYKAAPNIPTPIRTPLSLRSSFLVPRVESSSGNREMEGGEKLESGASSPQLSPTGAKTKAQPAEKEKTEVHRNYEYFQGNTYFCIGGRLQNTRHRPVNIATGFFVVLPAILFLIFSAPWIWHNISPAIPVTFAYMFFICISSFLHASASDPGVSSIPPSKGLAGSLSTDVGIRSCPEMCTDFLRRMRTRIPSGSALRQRSGH